MPSASPLTEDQLTVTFGGSNISITDFTSYRIERDFMVAADHFELVLEDDRVNQLVSQIQIGQQLTFTLNNALVMIGYIDDIDWQITPAGGNSVVITGRDLLGQAAQAKVLPNLGLNVATNVVFPASTTYLQAFRVLFGHFTATNDLIAIVDTDDAALTLSTGGKVGLRSHGKNPVRSLQSSLNRLCKPDVGDSYLSYAKKLANTIGCFIKMVYIDGKEYVYIAPPTYDRSDTDFYYVYHSIVKSNPNQNAAVDLRWRFSYKDQPSVIIGQCTYGAPGYKKTTSKAIRVNEITGYQAPPNNGLVVPAVAQVTASLSQDFGYSVVGGAYGNTDLKKVLLSLPVTTNTPFSRPEYYESMNAHSMQELQFDVAFEMSKKQNEFLTLEVDVQGHSSHTDSGIKNWQPNMMCHVYDDSLSKIVQTDLWIQKVVYTRTVNDGPMTNLTMRLPYVFEQL